MYPAKYHFVFKRKIQYYFPQNIFHVEQLYYSCYIVASIQFLNGIANNSCITLIIINFINCENNLEAI